MRPRVSSLTSSFLLGLLLLLVDQDLLAQVIQPDSSLVRIDSLATDSTQNKIVLSWDKVLRPNIGDSSDVLVTHSRAKEFLELFDGKNGHYQFQQGGVGLPSHLSSFGLPTSASQLNLDGLPLENPLTGEADWDFAPMDYALTSMESAAGSGHVSTFSAKSRLITSDVPYTELKYFSGSNGLQAVNALHSQSRQRKIFDRDYLLNASLRYRGGAATGEFTNSNYRHREIGARLLFAFPTWFLNLDLSSGNHRNGVNGGVVVNDGEAYDTIYDRFGASVNFSNYRRTKKRSHLRADFGFDWIGKEHPLEATLFWQNNLNRFFTDTTAAIHVNRVGLMIKQGMRMGRHNLEGRFLYWKDGAGAESTWDNFGSETDFQLTDRFEFRGTKIDGRLNIGSERGQAKGAYSLSLGRKISAFRFLAEWRDAKTVPHLIYQNGFSPFVDGTFRSTSQIKSGRTSLARILLGNSVGDFALGLEGYFSQSSSQPIPLNARDIPPSEGGPIYQDSHSGTGVAGHFSWRELSSRGFYFSSKLQYFNSSGETNFFFFGAIPEFSGKASVGLKYQLFDRELLMHSYFDFEYQSTSTALVLENSTALLTRSIVCVVCNPSEYHGVLDARGILDFWTDAEIRGATIFVGVENLLAPWLDAGSSSLYYNPLPDLAVRVGILWPISG